MTQPPVPTTRHLLRAGLPALGAGLAVVLAMIVGYLLLPEPTGEDPPWLVFVTIAIVTVIYSMAAVWALIRINQSTHPLRTGFILLAVMVTAMVVIFSLAYLSLSIDNPANFNIPLDKVASLYFTMTILSTVGFGDITAVTNPARVAVMIQMVVGLTLITALARVLVEAARHAQRRKMAEGSTDG